MTTIKATPPTTNLVPGGAPNGMKAKLRAAARREADLYARLEKSKETAAKQQGEIRSLKSQLAKLDRPVEANLPALVRAHRAAIEDGVGNWGETEAALFKAVK